jgi:hypothetical protein
MAGAIVRELYLVCDGYDAMSHDTAILLTTDKEHEAREHAEAFNAVVYRYDVTDDDDLVNEQVMYRGNRPLDPAGVAGVAGGACDA